MSKPDTSPSIDGRRLLTWCGYAALAGLFIGIGAGIAVIA